MTEDRKELERELRTINGYISSYTDTIRYLSKRKYQIEMLLARMEDSKQLDLLDYV